MVRQSGLPGQRDSISTTPRNIVASYTPRPGYIVGGIVIDATYSYDGSQSTGDEQKLRAGIPMAKITSSGLWCPCKRTRVNGTNGSATAITVDDARFFQDTDTLTIGAGSEGPGVARHVGTIQDDDSAASNGTAVYLHIDELGAEVIGHLESVTANNADSDFDINNGGPTVIVTDDDAAATAGLQVYFDEDATNPEDRFLANNTTNGVDVFVAASDGSLIRIKHDASASSNGVALYFDDDAANTYERLLFISPTNADGTYATDDAVGLIDGTITRGSTAAISSINYSTNVITLSSAVEVLDGDDVYADNIPGAEICRGFLNEYINMVDEDNTARDKVASKVINRGHLDASMILGDLAAIRDNDNATHYVSGITWDDWAGNA